MTATGTTGFDRPGAAAPPSHRAMPNICVFCGSAPGRDPAYREAADALGRAIARRGWGLVYGGATVGLMGVVADAALAEGGRVIGVIPTALVNRELAHHGVTDLRIVSSMHERKLLMAALSDAYVSLPGGVGTLDELFEMLTWTVLGLHDKPNALLDVDGYYDTLRAFLDRSVRDGFLRESVRDGLIVHTDPATLLDTVELEWAPEVRARAATDPAAPPSATITDP